MQEELPLSDEVQGFIESIDIRSKRRVSPKDQESDDTCRRAVEMIVSEVIDSREALTKSTRKDIFLDRRSVGSTASAGHLGPAQRPVYS